MKKTITKKKHKHEVGPSWRGRWSPNKNRPGGRLRDLHGVHLQKLKPPSTGEREQGPYVSTTNTALLEEKRTKHT